MERHDIRQQGGVFIGQGEPIRQPIDNLTAAVIRFAYRDATRGTKAQREDALDYFRSPFFVDHCDLLDLQPDRLIFEEI